MTDLEMTRLCAEAMRGESVAALEFLEEGDRGGYEPLTNNAQAMALVKKCGLSIRNYVDHWRVSEIGGDDIHQDDDGVNTDLNRAIVECVANMQKEKGAASA